MDTKKEYVPYICFPNFEGVRGEGGIDSSFLMHAFLTIGLQDAASLDYKPLSVYT